MTKEQLDEIESRARKATAGPWRVDDEDEDKPMAVCSPNQANAPIALCDGLYPEHDSAHIAGLSPEIALGLVEELRSATSRAELMEKRVDALWNLRGYEQTLAASGPDDKDAWLNSANAVWHARMACRSLGLKV